VSVPRVSVILPVYNGAEFLEESLKSVLNQTFRDFEVLVMDDASTDDSAGIARGFRDPRVRVIRHVQNMRLPETLNHGLELACGELIARMDADDICAPRRFEQQVDLLDLHPEIGICGGWVRLFGCAANVTRKYPVSPDAIEAFRHFNCPFGHPTVMLRRGLLEANGLRYDPRAAAVEDFELWTRLLKLTRGANLPEVLLEYRLHEASVTSRDWTVMNGNSAQVLSAALKDILPDVTEEQARFHRQVSMAEIPPDITSLRKADEWLVKIAPVLDKSRDARKVLREVWFRLAMRVAPSEGISSLRQAFGGAFTRKYGLSMRQRALIVGSAFKAWAGRRG
jgi:glycosyltransferase involved in cell wall biosynthesis